MSGTTFISPLPSGGTSEPSIAIQPRRNATVTEYINSTATPTILINTNIISTDITTLYITTIPPVSDPAATAAILANNANNTSMNTTNFIILVSIGGTNILLLILLAIALILYLHRRRQNSSSNVTASEPTPPPTSLAPQISPFTPLTTTLSEPRPPPSTGVFSASKKQIRLHNLTPHALTTNFPPPKPPPVGKPPTRPRRSISAPLLKPDIQAPQSLTNSPPIATQQPPLPRISIQPTTPSSIYSEKSLLSPITRPRTAQTPFPPRWREENEYRTSEIATRTPGPPPSLSPRRPATAKAAGTSRFREALPDEVRGRIANIDRKIEKRERRMSIQDNNAATGGGIMRYLNPIGDNSGAGRSEKEQIVGGRMRENTNSVSTEMMFIHRDMRRDNHRSDESGGTRASSGVFPEL